MINEDIQIKASGEPSSEDIMLNALSNALAREGDSSSPELTLTEYDAVCDESTGREYTVYMSHDELYDRVRQRMSDWLYGDGVGQSIYDINTLSTYADKESFRDLLEEYTNDYVYELDDDELIDELESHAIIGEDDKIQDPDWTPDQNDPDEEPVMIYPPQLIEKSKGKLVDRIISEWYDPVEWFMDTYGDDSLRELADDHPEYFDVDSYIEDELDDEENVYYWASFNGNVIEFSFTDADGSDVHAYAAQEE